MGNITERLSEISRLIRTGSIPPDQLRKKLRQIAIESEDEDQKFAGLWAKEHDVNIIQIGSSGRRSADDFVYSKKKPLSSGPAFRCVIGAVVHPDIGIGVAHNRSITRDRWIDTYISLQQSISYIKSLGDIARITAEGFVDMEAIHDQLSLSVSQALTQFKIISHGEVPSGTIVLAGGIDYLTYKQIGDLNNHFKDSLLSLVSFVPQHQSMFGKSCAITYGGKNHYEYNVPKFDLC